MNGGKEDFPGKENKWERKGKRREFERWKKEKVCFYFLVAMGKL